MPQCTLRLAVDVLAHINRSLRAYGQPSDEDMELDREMEYLVEPEEAEARGITEVE